MGKELHTGTVQGYPLLTRREALTLSAGVTLAAALGASPSEDAMVDHLPKGRLVLLGGGTAPHLGQPMKASDEMALIAGENHIPADKVSSAKQVRDKLSAEELSLMAKACDPSGVFHELVRKVPLTGKTVVCVTSATEDTIDSADYNSYLFRFLGANDVVTVTDRAQAELPGVAAAINSKNMALVYLGVGDQTRLAREFAGTKACRAMRRRYLNDADFTVMGNSAGAAVVPGDGVMIDNWNVNKTGAAMASGLELLQKITVDTHMHNKKRLPRLPRLQDAVAQSGGMGLGLDEGTGVVIKNGVAEVIGLQKVWQLMPGDQRLSLEALEKLSGFVRGDKIELGPYARLAVPASMLDDAKAPGAGRAPGR